MNSKIIISAFVLGLTVTACGGGSTEPVDTTASITLNSFAEGGSSANFSALLLHRFLGSSSNITGIVLLHGRGGNPDSAVVRQLRKDLYDRGYTTLSIQEAVPAGYVEGEGGTKAPPYSAYINDVNNANSVFLETYARVRTAINELESRGMKQVVVIGFSIGSRIAAAHVAIGIGRGQIDELPIIGLVGIGMYAGASDPDPLRTTLTLDEVSIPVLDLYGDNDTGSASTAIARKAAYDSGSGTNYTQISLSCDVGLSTNECHKLVNLKGTSTSPLEVAVSNWIANL